MQKTKIIVLAVVILFGFCLVRDFLVKSLIGTIASNVTGAPTHIGGLSLSVIRQSIKISDFRMYNPKGFPRDILVDIPKIAVVCKLEALIKGKIHLKRIDFELKEVVTIKNKEGKFNVDSLKIIDEQKARAPERRAKEMAIQIDLANLAIGRIVNKDYSIEGSPVIKVYDVNLKKSYQNITSIQQLAVLIISEPLKAAGIKGLNVYATSLVTGVAALPMAAVFTFAGKDNAQASFNVTMEEAYAAGLEVLKEMGVIQSENKTNGIINAVVSGTNINFKIKKINDTTTEITVSARKLMFPKPEVASGVIYQIANKLK